MKAIILFAAFALLATAYGYPQVSYDCRLPNCVEGTPMDFNLTFGATQAELTETEKWKPASIFYHNITISADGKTVAEVDRDFNITDSNQTETYNASGLVPSGNGSVGLELCYNKSAYGRIYALNVGTASGVNKGIVHTRNDFLFTWSRYVKSNWTCEPIGNITIIPRATVRCIGDSECGDNESCEGYQCAPVTCEGSCVLVANHSCFEPDCCSSESCSAGKECISNECKPLACNENQATGEHSCRDINCWFFEKREGQGCSLDWLRIIVILALVAIVVIRFRLL